MRSDGRERAASVVVSAALHGLVLLALVSAAPPNDDAPPALRSFPAAL
jgi:hypothetical protein